MATAEQLILDYREADLPPNQRAFCDYAVKLTLTPGAMTQQDVDGLRTIGYTDEQISIGTQVIAYFNYINRIADALGVDHEDWMEMPEQEWVQKKANFHA